MIEVWCKKAWNGLASPRRKLAGRARDVFDRVISRRLGMAITITTPLLVILWHLIALASRPAHLDEIVAEAHSPSIGSFRGNLMPDNSGTRLLYLGGENEGINLYFCKIGDPKKQMLFREKNGQRSMPSETFLGWSPDDRFFAYGRRSNEWQLVICDGDTGDTLTTKRVTRPFLLGSWLTTQKLAVATVNNILYTVENSRGTWSVRPFAYFHDAAHGLPGEPMRNLEAFSDDSVVWQQGNAIWSCSEDFGEPEKIWDGTTNTLIEFSYSEPARRFLLHCADENGQFFADFYPYGDSQLENITRIDADQYDPTNLTLINGGKGYAFLSQIGITNLLVIKANESQGPVKFQWPDQIKGFAMGRHEIFAVSSLKQGPFEIDQYDIASGSIQCAVPAAEKDQAYMTNCTITRNEITNANGETLTCYLYQPPRTGSLKKHPLIIGIHGGERPGFAWTSYYEALGEAGNYYAYAEHRDFSEWADDAFTVYKCLTQRPDIDTNCVYLFGVSAGAPATYDLLGEHPGLWRGAVLWNPVGFPDRSRIAGLRFFIDTGEDDPAWGKEGSQAPIDFQDEAAKHGVPVTLLVHPASGHILNTIEGGRERLRETLNFLSGP